MYIIHSKHSLYFLRVLLWTLNFLGTAGFCQEPTARAEYHLSLQEAIDLAKTRSKWVTAAQIAEKAAEAEEKDALNAALPFIGAATSYQRYSRLTLYTDGLRHAQSVPFLPTYNAANLGMEASFTIYAGGRQRALVQEQAARTTLAGTQINETSANAALQAAVQYLDMLRLNEQRRFILEQQKRAEARLKDINVLYQNQKVTRSDVLRAEVMLSNVQLSLQQTENDILIANQKLDVLMNFPDTVRIEPTDTVGILKPRAELIKPVLENAGENAYGIQKVREIMEIQQAGLKGLRSTNLPTIQFYTAYGLNYPNFLFYPPVDQAYSVGFVGLKAQYSLSSLYHNKQKIAASQLRIKNLSIQQQALTEDIHQEVKSYNIKYYEALNRIAVIERSIEQARINYSIVNTKYFNQLALLTDLLDADNLYQESRFNLIKAQTDALAIFYQMLYAVGKL